MALVVVISDPSLTAFVRENPLAAASGIIGFAITCAGGGWWFANAIVKSRLDVLQERITLFREHEGRLKDTVIELTKALNAQPQTPAVTEQTARINAALADLQDAKVTVMDAARDAAQVASGLWTNIASLFEESPAAARAPNPEEGRAAKANAEDMDDRRTS